jgi:hypothetical protein
MYLRLESIYSIYVLLQVSELLCKCSSLIDIQEMGGHVARMGEKRIVYRLLVGKPEGKGPLGKTKT